MDFDPALTPHRRLLAQRIESLLLGAGFTEEAVPSVVKERVFYRAVEGVAGVRVQVYTTIVGHGPLAEVRVFGGEVIRVCAVYRTKLRFDRGILGDGRIHRRGTVEDICDRLLAEMRRTYGRARRAAQCGRCGAPTFVSRKGNAVCADVCFSRDPVQAQGDPV